MNKKIFILMAYLNLVSRVIIGQVELNNINSFTIEENITEVSDAATIIIPRNFKKIAGKEVKDYINVGDRVYIEAGYVETGVDLEFAGYVKEISADIPIQIVCDQVFPLRGNNFIKSYSSVTLKNLLTDITRGINSFQHTPYKIECPDVSLGKFMIDNASSYQVLTKLKHDFGFYSRINGDILHVGFAWDWKPDFTQKHQYIIQENVKNARQLKFKAARDFNTVIKVRINYPDGKRDFVTAGSKDKDSAVVTVPFGARTKKEAQDIANARLKQYTYDGYTGSITGFGIPRVHAGDSIEIIDKVEKERQGVYLVEKVTQNYSVNGYERNCAISYKI